MHKFGVQIELEALRDARTTWKQAYTKFMSDHDLILERLLNEAAANFMSVAQVAKASGLTTTQVRARMRNAGLNPKDGKRLLAKKSAEALQENAALLGIEPHEMDLMSPLAYLPMGEELRKSIEDAAKMDLNEYTFAIEVSGNWRVTEVREGDDRLYEVYDKDDCFIASFNSEADADRVVALVNRA